jgi:DNA invertase Pin-like site-specific DNA recombinase
MRVAIYARVSTDDKGQEEPGRRAAPNLMTKDEARKIAAGIAKLPELVKRPQ